jgi:penicillin-binding protein 1B
MRGIRSVLTAEGEPLKRYPFQIQQRFDAGSIYLIQNAMQRVMREGTGSSVYKVLPSNLTLAGKTGTSNDSRDSWFAGFGQDVLAVVWMGRDDNGKTPFTGATGALQVWTSFMRKADPLPIVVGDRRARVHHGNGTALHTGATTEQSQSCHSWKQPLVHVKPSLLNSSSP